MSMELSNIKKFQEFFHITRFFKSNVKYLGSFNPIFIINFQFVQHDSSSIHDFISQLLKTTIQHDQVLKQEACFLQFLSHHQNFYAVVLTLAKVLQPAIQDLHICYIHIE